MLNAPFTGVASQTLCTCEDEAGTAQQMLPAYMCSHHLLRGKVNPKPIRMALQVEAQNKRSPWYCSAPTGGLLLKNCSMKVLGPYAVMSLHAYSQERLNLRAGVEKVLSLFGWQHLTAAQQQQHSSSSTEGIRACSANVHNRVEIAHRQSG